jgi:hypothetical protein
MANANNEQSIMGMIESEIGGSPICESVKQIADVLFESEIETVEEPAEKPVE